MECSYKESIYETNIIDKQQIIYFIIFIFSLTLIDLNKMLKLVLLKIKITST